MVRAACIKDLKGQPSMRGQAKPHVLFVDRGKGFYVSRTAQITAPFKDALRQHDLAAFMGAMRGSNQARWPRSSST